MKNDPSAPETRRPRRKPGRGAIGISLGMLVGWMSSQTTALNAQDNIRLRSTPYLPFGEPDPSDYNIKLGSLKARFRGSLQMEYNDNINLSDSRQESDLTISPHVNTGLFWRINQDHLLEFNLGIGYRWYLDHSELNSFDISPTSRISHQFKAGDFLFNVYDSFSIQVDPTSRGEISGGTGLLEFRRLHNTIGLTTNWKPREDLIFSGGYSYSLDRSISDDFASIDLNHHVLTGGVYYDPEVRWTFGLSGSAGVIEYVEDFQNDGVSYSIGPVVSFRPSQFLLFQANVAFSYTDYDESGTIADRSDAEVVNYSLTARHDVNRRMDHSLRLRKTDSPGLGSNFTEILAVQYAVNLKIFSATGINLRSSYENIEASGSFGESAHRFLNVLSVNKQINRDWSAGVSYSFALKNSELANRDYVQNRVMLLANRQF